MVRLVRFYSWATLAGILVAAVALTLFFRNATIREIHQLGERSNRVLAQATLNVLNPELADHLAKIADVGPNTPPVPPLPANIAAHLDALMRETSVVRVSICNRRGVVVFSTFPSLIGLDRHESPSFLSAINGKVFSTFVYRDALNDQEGSNDEDNLMSTYLPVRRTPSGATQGVFSITTDMSPLIVQNERLVITVMCGALIILALLYGALLWVAQRAKTFIEQQQQTIQERTAMLEMLAARMLTGEEQEKKKLAVDLHEGLAQTLSAVKVAIEVSQPNGAGEPVDEPLLGIVPILQDAIDDVRSIATELRPSSLDDLGLISTLNWLCREFEQMYPGIRIEREWAVTESQIPAPLKITIYRVVESALRTIGHRGISGAIRLTLEGQDRGIGLTLDERPGVPHPATDQSPESRFAEAQERAVLSGGTFSVTQNTAGGATLHSAWPL